MSETMPRTPRRRVVGTKGNAMAGEGTPLVPDDGDVEQGLPSSSFEDEPIEAEGELLKPIKEGSKREMLVGIFGAITFLASALAMLINGGLFVFISGLFGIGFSPYAAFQQQKITQTIAMKETNAFFEKELDRLKESNERLSKNVSEMTSSIGHLKNMEKTLGLVQNMQGDCVKQLEEQLQKQREIAAMTHSSVENEIISNIFEIALNCDDGDMKLSDEEVNALIHKIETINGVDIREEKIRQVMESHGRDLMSLMEVAKNLLKHDIPDEEKLFVLL